jgi:hypothetical protein
MMGYGFNMSLPGIGLYASMEDKIRLYTQCGTDDDDGLSTVEVQVGNDGKHFEFGVLTSTRVRAVTYEMCWCQPSPTMLCNAASHFSTKMGTLKVLQGPSAVQSGSPYSCALGPNCVVTLEGDGLNSKDRLSVMDTCGGSPVDGFDGVCTDSTCVASVATPPTAEGTRFTWSASIINATAGNYRLCWCHGSAANCGSASAFFRDVGQMTVLGSPTREQSFQCVAGQACSLIVTGEAVTGTWVRILSHCASGTDVAGLPEGAMQGTGANSGIATFSWPNKVSVLAVTKARLCWCGDTFVGSCASSADFAFEIGEVEVSAPSGANQVQQFSCYAGRSCSVNDLEGVSLKDDDTLMVMPVSFCGDASLNVVGFPSDGGWSSLSRTSHVGESGLATAGGRNFSWGSAEVFAEPGLYDLCWCRGAPAACSRSDYRVAAARLQLKGPDSGQVFQCAYDVDCQIQSLQGEGLEDGDQLQIISYLFPCNSPSKPSLPLGAASADAGSSGTDFTFSGNTTFVSLAGIYRMCWCKPITGLSSCDKLVDVGRLHVGVSFQSLAEEVMLGYAFSVRLNGIGLYTSLEDKIRLYRKCGTADNDGLSTVEVQVGADGKLYDFGTLTSDRVLGGVSYEMCWCQRSPTTVCSAVADFATKVGSLRVHQGPSSTQTGSPYSCTRGPNCIVTLEGERLGSRDRLSVMETCGGRSVNGFEGLCRDGFCIASAADPPTREGTRFYLVVGHCQCYSRKLSSLLVPWINQP